MSNKRFSKKRWKEEVGSAIQEASCVFDQLQLAFDEFSNWNKDADCSFSDVEYALMLAFDDIDKKKRELEYLVHKKGWPFVEKMRDIQFDLDMEEIGRICGQVNDLPDVNDLPVCTFSELREERLATQRWESEK